MKFFTATIYTHHGTHEWEMLIDRIPTRPGCYSYRAKAHIGLPFADPDNNTEFINDSPLEWDEAVEEFFKTKFFLPYIEVTNITELRF